ncbi:MAG TPA: PAS domain S-box protein [Nannocystaceae bacterium]|nr:PAS domain S-box protein [Nannocystaceae bacterium]
MGTPRKTDHLAKADESELGASRIAWFEEAELPALHDFWSVYASHYDEARAVTIAQALEHPHLRALIDAMSPQQLDESNRGSRERLRQAIGGDWAAYELDLRRQGGVYASLGVEFRDWYEIVRAFTRCITPYLITAWPNEAPRVSAAVLAMQKLVDYSMTVIGESYIDANAAAQRESDQRLAITLESIGDAVIATDEHGKVLLLNRVAETLTGFPKAEAIGRPLAEIFDISNELTGLRAPNPVERVIAEGKVIGLANHTVLVAKDGTRRSIADSAAPIREVDGRISGVVMVFRDVTSEQLAAVALHESEARKAAVLESALEGVVMMDVHGNIIEFNPAAEQMFGRVRAQVLGQPLEDTIIPPAFRERHRRGLARHLVSGERAVLGRRLELPAMRADGSEFPAEISVARVELPGPPTFTGFIRDISDRKRAEQALRSAEERFMRLVASSVVGIVVGDFSGVITEANDAFLAIAGRTRAELDAGALRWADPADATDRALIDLLARTGGAPTWERELVAADGTTTPALFGVTMCEPPSFIAVVLDLSERKGLERARARSAELELENRRAQDASRLKSEFLANMSHELRTPLNAIIGFTELIHDGEVRPDMPQFKEFLGDILTSGRHLLQLINDVLDLSKVEAGKLEFQPELIDLERVFSEVLAILRTTSASKHIRIESFIEPEVRSVEIDGARLKQVLYNYLSNALKFTPDGGKVSLRATAAGPEAFRIEVADTGIGIAADDIPRLFVEFQQLEGDARQRRLGTGLGLALTRRLVVAQGGEVGVKSEVGKGSVFHAVLPRRARVGTPLPPPRRFPAPHASAPRVLVIEDDARDQELLVATLGEAGYSIETAASGAQALASCRARRFDAIVLDLLLPDIGGLQLLRRLRGEDPHRAVPVVVVTVVTEQGVAAGFAVHDVLPKPLDGDALIAALARAGVGADVGAPILVVDDDEASRRLMNASLGQLGHVAQCVASGEAALASARETTPAAVVLDLMMPGMDGFQFLERFRGLASCRRVPVIVWTGKDLTAADHARLREFVQAVVPKGMRGAGAVVEELARFVRAANGGER